jgi:TonB family protein
MKYLFISVFILLSIKAYSQGTNTFDNDTINIRGYIYYDNGKPVFGTQLKSVNKDLKYDQYVSTAYTDSTGYFELKGAKHLDSIFVRAPFNTGTYYNRGSRFMVITFPSPSSHELNDNKPLIISAPRVSTPKKSRFGIVKYQKPEDFTLVTYEVLPEYPGGTDRFYKYIKSQLTYPDKAIKANIEGRVQVAFTINKNGALGNVKIIRGLGYGCDEMVLQTLRQCSKWNPGRFNGRAIEVDYTVSIDFKLTNK